MNPFFEAATWFRLQGLGGPSTWTTHFFWSQLVPWERMLPQDPGPVRECEQCSGLRNPAPKTLVNQRTKEKQSFISDLLSRLGVQQQATESEPRTILNSLNSSKGVTYGLGFRVSTSKREFYRGR